MIGQPPLEINLEFLPKEAIVADIVYRPLMTELLKAAQKRGNNIVDGLGMLLYQAVVGFNMWFSEELGSKGIRGVEVTSELRKKIENLL
jgi:shikimate dehydrogenase